MIQIEVNRDLNNKMKQESQRTEIKSDVNERLNIKITDRIQKHIVEKTKFQYNSNKLYPHKSNLFLLQRRGKSAFDLSYSMLSSISRINVGNVRIILQTTAMLTLYISLFCSFMFLWVQFSGFCNTVLMCLLSTNNTWLGLGRDHVLA